MNCMRLVHSLLQSALLNVHHTPTERVCHSIQYNMVSHTTPIYMCELLPNTVGEKNQLNKYFVQLLDHSHNISSCKAKQTKNTLKKIKKEIFLWTNCNTILHFHSKHNIIVLQLLSISGLLSDCFWPWHTMLQKNFPNYMILPNNPD